MITFSQLGSLGRLGNQLWQLASTIGISLKNNQEFTFPEWKYSKFFKNRLPVLKENHAFKTYQEVSSGYSEINLSNGDWDLQGYFQSFKYFENYKDIIKYYFTPSFLLDNNCINKVSIHVRRGDYLSLSHIHPNLTLDYYAEAMSYFPDSEFSIFSDDSEWCKKIFDFKFCSFIEPSVDVMDLFYMSKHKHHIIANSSYSWWSAWLGSGTVIAPKVWALNEPEETINDRLPVDWIRI